MFAWVIYDLTDARIRRRVVETCKDFGLVRFQRSVFFGEVSSSGFERVAEVMTEVTRPREGEARTDTDSVLVLPLCERCLSRKVVIGKPFDEERFRKRRYRIIG